ncbi:MAG: CBS domain-containing protein [Chloroflexota bacterium]
MTTVARLLDAKDHNVWSIPPDAMVLDAIKLMAEKGVGALLVMQGQTLVGILSERDYARKIILQDRSSRDTPVSQIMTGNVVYVRPEQTVEDCMALMTAKHIRHLPVLQGDQVMGVVSIGDLVKSVIADREHLIEQLENYITGR